MMQTEHQARIEKFMKGVARQEVPAAPTMPFYDTRLLRARLIMEEALETVEALGFRCCWVDDYDSLPINMSTIGFCFGKILEPNLTKIADGCADLSVVAIGTLSACGIKDRPLLEEVDRSNLTKAGGYTDANTGKWVKPLTYSPPDIEKVLEDQRCTTR